ncbi:hypothetical protein CEUSTIGMA_g9044.t1 [Chlamydomonas eustigma]|uniref:Uncharacterized protein n=1 Tax=Chlamydomonas eustigma TaxID=1157962 RepID=A0A250XF10_9CHLO|nr:hypothetical protein CEUSTIGMA_g9044.t1 [Chlamydomonas eustigma]|eukprot:GAX81616.1 hypothetical protein CEUSTIGMA_g9044.t1 [Chlamydomonas eustigma]
MYQWYDKLFLKGLCAIPVSHNSIYEREPGYTWEDWAKYRNANFRTRPEPLVFVKVAVGFWLHLMLVAVISIFVGLYFQYFIPEGAPNVLANNFGSLLSVATFFMTLLMVFRLNQSYSRWWEGRTQWGSNLAAMRNYMRMMATWATPQTAWASEAAMRWTPAAARVLKEHCRAGGDGIAAVKDILVPSEIEYLQSHANKPLAAAHVMSQLASELKCPDILQAQMQEQISLYILYAAGNERIMRTPLPTGYSRFTSRACMMYICIIPLLLWPISGWLTPLVAVAIAFMVMGVENVTVQIEEPFRVLHLEALVSAVEQAGRELKPWIGPAVSDIIFKKLSCGDSSKQAEMIKVNPTVTHKNESLMSQQNYSSSSDSTQQPINYQITEGVLGSECDASEGVVQIVTH